MAQILVPVQSQAFAAAQAPLVRLVGWLVDQWQGAMKAASTMTCDRISSCAATKVLVTTPNRVSSTSQNPVERAR